jgi:uncharacterized protein (UPF0212 family)
VRFSAEDNEFLDDIDDSDDDSFPSQLMKTGDSESQAPLDYVKINAGEDRVPTPTAPKCDCSHCTAQEQTDQVVTF